MKTKKVKPVLVESESKSCKGDLVIVTQKLGIHIANTEPSYHNKQELILISLEDEEIEEGSVVLFKNKVLTVVEFTHDDTVVFKEEIAEDLNLNEYNEMAFKEVAKKVIARQSQISPELIHQLIGEYNNGGMKDFKIEVEVMKIWDNIQSVINNPSRSPDSIKIKPKLTNGFVTIVKEEYSYNLLCNMQYYMEYCVSNGYVTPQEWLKNFKHYSDRKEPILYTEEEVESILTEYSKALQPILIKHLIELTPVRWFRENKKKIKQLLTNTKQ